MRHWQARWRQAISSPVGIWMAPLRNDLSTQLQLNNFFQPNVNFINVSMQSWKQGSFLYLSATEELLLKMKTTTCRPTWPVSYLLHPSCYDSELFLRSCVNKLITFIINNASLKQGVGLSLPLFLLLENQRKANFVLAILVLIIIVHAKILVYYSCAVTASQCIWQELSISHE